MKCTRLRCEVEPCSTFAIADGAPRGRHHQVHAPEATLEEGPGEADPELVA
jgi:hypothetical protein